MKNSIIIILLFSCVILLAYKIQDFEEAKNKPINELIFFPSGKFINQIALDNKGVIADFLWLQTVQYYGQHVFTDRQLKHLYKLFDVITILDPQFQQCYVFGGTIITYDQKRPDLGMKILNKGMINMPDSWQIPFIKGFLYYIYLKDYKKASHWFKFASTKPDAPYYCESFAAFSLMKNKNYITSLKMWSEIYKKGNKYQKKSAVNSIIMIIKKEMNTKCEDLSTQEKIKYVKNEVKKYDFIPFELHFTMHNDSIVIEGPKE